MRPEQASAGNDPRPARAESAEVDGLHATCRRQLRVIDALGEVVSNLRGGAAALKAENAELRAESDRVRRGSARPRGSAHVDAGDVLEVLLPQNVRAPGAAR